MSVKEKLDSFNAREAGIILSQGSGSRLPSLLVLELQGYLDTENSSLFLEFVRTLLKEEERRSLVLDMEGLTYASSTGLGAMTSLLIDCRDSQVSLELCRIRPKVHSVMDLLGFTSFFSISEDVQQITSQTH